MLAEDVLRGKVEVGQSVMVVGGGLVGLEVADVLAGQGKAVRLVEMLDELAADLPVLNRPGIIHNFKMSGALAHVRARAEEIMENGARVTINGAPEFFAVDTVVVAVGREVDDSLVRSLEAQAPEFYVIGDANGNGRIREATAEGYRLGMSLQGEHLPFRTLPARWPPSSELPGPSSRSERRTHAIECHRRNLNSATAPMVTNHEDQEANIGNDTSVDGGT